MSRYYRVRVSLSEELYSKIIEAQRVLFETKRMYFPTISKIICYLLTEYFNNAFYTQYKECKKDGISVEVPQSQVPQSEVQQSQN